MKQTVGYTNFMRLEFKKVKLNSQDSAVSKHQSSQWTWVFLTNQGSQLPRDLSH